MKTLVIAEKPSMGRTIAAVIEPRGKNHKTYIEGENYIITWAVGHLVELAQPEKYDPKYKRWNLGDLPIIPQSFKLVPNYKTRDQLKTIAELSKRSKLLINACDAGREGQLIFYFIQSHLKLKQSVKRLWISDLTPETIRRGFQQLKDEAEYVNLTKAARSRSEADWLVGMNGSRAFTSQVKSLVSVGRVQTPVLALIYDRQKEIEDFKVTNYYEIEAQFQQDDLVYKGKWVGERILDRKLAELIAEKVKGKPGQISQYDNKPTKEFPNKLYDLTLLQREANSKYHFSAKKTLDLAQALYEKHKVISYPRTNSNYVNEENIPEMHRTLDSLRGTDYDALVSGANKSLVHRNNRSVCNPAKVEDHHAILPTHKRAGKLTPDEQKLYDMIVRRFLCQFYPPAEYHVHTVMTQTEGETFKTQVKQLLSPGWKVVYPETPRPKRKRDNEEEEEISSAFSVDPGKDVLCLLAECKDKETSPPSLYTEGTLLKAMESAGRRMEDDELREAMKDTGLGTPATRAAVIERLKKVGYISMEGKKIGLSPKGRSTIEWIRQIGIELLTSPEMTGQWERRLNQIAKGQASDTSFLEQVKKLAHLIVDKVRDQPLPTSTKESMHRTAASERSPLGGCPREGCEGVIVEGRKGYGCTHFKQGCSFVVWKNSFGKKLSESMVKTLLAKGKTGKLKFKSKAGKPYEAMLVLKNKNTGELELEFINQKKAEM